ncbi:MAG: hypothetical protein U0694_07740 [Anaerolineae bacterium]
MHTINPADEKFFLSTLDNTQKSNKLLIEQLGWRQDRYSSVKESLLAKGLIERTRGQGGGVKKTEQIEPKEVKLKEIQSYEAVSKQLLQMWITRYDFNPNNIVMEITAKQGRRSTGGKWSRPDITLITYKNYDFLPSPTLEVISFEIKTDVSQMDISAVHEALAQSRFVNKSYIIFVLTRNGQENIVDLTNDITEEAAKYDVGFIIVDDINDYTTWKIELDAYRHDPDPELINNFISIQLSQESNKDQIRKWYTKP